MAAREGGGDDGVRPILDMNISIDPSGNIIVHDCGCSRHGSAALWDDHELEWRRLHRGEVMRIITDIERSVLKAPVPPPGGRSLTRFALARSNAAHERPKATPR